MNRWTKKYAHLTVMAGAAVAPALGTISEHFAGESGTLVQMIISMPAGGIFSADTCAFILNTWKKMPEKG